MDWKIFGIAALIFLLLGGVIGHYVYRQAIYQDRVVARDIPVQLTQRILDSLELAFKVKVKAQKSVVFVSDTLSKREADSLRREIFAFKDSIDRRGDYQLGYKNDSLGRYGDTLAVAASFKTDTIAIDFRPRDRIFIPSIPDTTIEVSVPDDSYDVWDILEALGYILLGALIAILGG